MCSAACGKIKCIPNWLLQSLLYEKHRRSVANTPRHVCDKDKACR